MYLKNCAVISLVLIFLLFVHSVNSFSCYTCSSSKNSECLTNPVQDKFITECNPKNELVNNGEMTIGKLNFTDEGIVVDNNTVLHMDIAKIKWRCIKMVSIVRNGGMMIGRTCLPRILHCASTRTTRCYSCKKELCNSAESPALALEMLAVLGVVGVYSTM
ncbi:uncharacterized protein LOC111693573 [Trichogramma pretiosum]|uniref:uncharacterized protein LOC111693573 n=1 Tax=Trichogramma pretiosum TaxID=7493 RepID=UPI000C71C8D8|nr:uncharacterized protein LOC111693573 [Trichogramma pretiosum]